MAKCLHCTYQQRSLSSLLNEPIFEQGFNVSPDFGKDSSVAPASTGCLTNKHDIVERVPTTKTLAASSSLSAEGTTLLDESPIGLVSSVQRTSFSPFGSSIANITLSQSEDFSLPIASQPEVSSLSASSVPLPTSLVAPL